MADALSLINLTVGSEDIYINGDDYPAGSVISLELIGPGTIHVVGGTVEITNIIGVEALSSSKLVASNDAQVTINGGVLGVNLLSAFSFELHDEATITYNASAIAVGLTDNLLNTFNVTYVGDESAAHFTYTPPALSLLGGLLVSANFNVDGMQDGDSFTVTGTNLRVRSDGPPEMQLTNQLPGLLSPLLVGLVRQTVNVNIDVTAQEWTDFTREPGLWMQGDTFTFPTEGFYNDVITGSAGNDAMDLGYLDQDGSTPPNEIDGSDGLDDKIDALAGNDTVHGREGDDTIWGREGRDVLYGDEGNDILFGGAGDDSLYGGEGDDALYGGEGINWLEGNAGDDHLYSGASRDSLFGGIGNDTLYALSSGITYGNRLEGGEGHDLLIASEGRDTLIGGDGNDTLIGGVNSRDLQGGAGDDHIVVGGKGEAWIPVKVNGGEDFDIVDYSLSLSGVAINLTQSATGFNGYDRDSYASYNELTSIEGVIGSIYDDTLTGDAQANILYGGAGNDTIEGGAGNDTLSGDAGNDTLRGGAGNDTFIWADGPDGASRGNDLILDFGSDDRLSNPAVLNDGDTTNNDSIDLSSIFNDATLEAYNTLNGTEFGNALAALNHDLEDGVINFNGEDMSGPTLTLQGITGGLTYDQTNVPCFTEGTMIDIGGREVPIESLKVGDVVQTLDHGLQEIRWIGRRRLGLTEMMTMPNLVPIRIAEGALDGRLPREPLLLSPQHRVLLRSKIAERMVEEREVLAAAKHLTDVDGIETAFDLNEVTYFHLLFDRHEIIRSNGCWTESLYTGPMALDALGSEAVAEIHSLFPELKDGAPEPARPLLKGGTARKLAARHVKNQMALVA